ncbi:MAG: Nif3-like dinuclear metal center hexameric protein [bacterium]|nr:Nif3-like dinuclear metal center hexameric protein [bacterium]
MVLDEIIAVLEMIAPEQMALDWDNVGLLVGDRAQDISSIYVALDADDYAIEQAKAKGAGLLLTHHPLIFSPLRRVNGDSFISRRVVKLLRSNMNCYAMHTNFDVARMGELAADRLELRNCCPLEYCLTVDDKAMGIGVVGDHPDADGISLAELCEQTKQAFGLDAVRLFGDTVQPVHKIAISPGSGKSMIGEAIDAGAQVLITGDIDHHSGIDALAQGLSIIDAGHYGLEHIFIDYMTQQLMTQLSGVSVYAQEHREPFATL